MKFDGLDSLALPSIGTGYLKFPSDIAAQVTLKTIIEFLKFNKSISYKVTVIIHENDQLTFKVIRDQNKCTVVPNRN
jgi:O-acetyl-ADP-ribose deacetylase (regulator of RNase III)